MEEKAREEEVNQPAGRSGGEIMIKDYFIKQGIKEAEIEEFIRKQFPLGDYSRTELQRTPLGIKIIIYTNKPGRIIGKSGKNINEMTEAVKKRFELDNPQLDVKVIRNPNLDPRIVAKQIASALEKGYNFKKIGNLTIKRVMGSGAIGAEIIISGKLGGGKGITGKFQEGYLKHCGEPVRTLVDYGFEEAQTRPGKIGIKVKIMKRFQDITGQIRDSVQHKIDIVGEEPEKPAEEKAELKPEKKDEKTEKPKTEKPKPETKPEKKADIPKPEKKAEKPKPSKPKTEKPEKKPPMKKGK
jgi:small subunit ribosomal protein S3